MKKIIIAIMLFFITLPVNAFTLKHIQFIQAEKDTRKQIFNDLENKLNDFYNLKSEKYSNQELKKQLEEINAKTFEDTFVLDKKGIQEYYNQFLKNKNNMAQNRAIYESLNDDFICVYKNLKKMFVEDIYKKEFASYQDTLYEKTQNINIVKRTEVYGKKYYLIYYKEGQEASTGNNIYKLSNYACDYSSGYECVKVIENWQQFKNEFLTRENPTLTKIINVIDDNIANALKVQDEIKDYSISYETKKLNNYYKNKYGNVKNCGDVSNVIIKGATPQTGCFYDADSLEVLQVINGGILARDYSWSSNKIFITTNRKFADGDNYIGRLLYKGFYKYTSVLGAPVTVRKFQEITIPGEQFYFIYK